MAPHVEKMFFLVMLVSTMLALLATVKFLAITRFITSRSAILPSSFRIDNREETAIFLTLRQQLLSGVKKKGFLKIREILTTKSSSLNETSVAKKGQFKKDLAMERLFEARRQRVEATCLRYSGFFQSKNDSANSHSHVSIASFKKGDPFHYILLDEKNKILHCSVPKVASTSWRRFYVQLGAGDKDADGGLDFDDWNATWPYLKPLSYYARMESYSAMWNRIQNYTKIMWVRDPVERLLSAWRSKFQLKNDHYWPNIGRVILSRFPENISPREISAGGPVPLEPFFRFLTDISAIPDGHWAAYQTLCLPCHINYDYIGKLEAGEAEANYVIGQVTQQDEILLPRKKPSETMQKLKKSAEVQFSRLSTDIIEDVLKMFEMDFEMFNYDKRPNSEE